MQTLSPEEKKLKEEAISNNRYCYVPVINDGGFTLGIALEGISGYCPTDYHSVKSWDEARKWADLCNERLGRSNDEVFEITASSMRH